MSATQQTLAQLVRSKYPGAYNDMDDVTLEKNVLAKYPQYGDLPRTQSQQSPQPPNPATGAGMEAQSLQQAKQYGTARATQPYEDQQAELQRRQIIAHNLQNANITPMTNASMLYAPVGAAKSLIGAKVGSTIGNRVAGPTGQAIGGLVGGVGASLPWENVNNWRTSLSSAVRNPATGKVMTPWEMAVNKALPDPYAPEAVPAKAIPRGTNYGQYLENQKAAARVPPPEAPLGSPENPGWMSKLPTRMPKPVAAPPPEAPLGSPENPGWMSKLPTRMPKPVAAPPPEMPSPFAGATASQGSRTGDIPQGSPTPFQPINQGSITKTAPFAEVPGINAPRGTTAAAQQPFEPLVYGSEAEANQIAQRNANLERQARAAGMYHAAQGSATKRTNLQQRIGKKYPWSAE